MDINRVAEVTFEAADIIEDMFLYHPWSEDQVAKGQLVKSALINAFTTIIANVPPCPDRTVALRKLREARMDCNSAITHSGKY